MRVTKADPYDRRAQGIGSTRTGSVVRSDKQTVVPLGMAVANETLKILFGTA